MHPDTRTPVRHPQLLAHHVETATHRVRIIDEPPAWPTEREMDAEMRGGMVVAALCVCVMVVCTLVALLVFA